MNLLAPRRVLVAERVGEPSDEDLMLGALRGERTAVTLLVERYHEPLFAYLFRSTDGNRYLAEDLLQDTFTRLLSPRTHAIGRPVKPWLYSIATNLVRDRHRRRRRDTDLGDAELIVDQSVDPGDRIVELEDAQVVRNAIRGLGEEQRVAILLRFYQACRWRR